MYEPCNVLQSGPCFDFVQPFCNLFWNLCSASAIQLLSEPMQLLCHPVHSHLLYVKTINETHHSGFPRFVSCLLNQWHVPEFSNRFLSHGTNRHNFPMTSSAMLKFNLNCKSQIPDSLFCFSLWATRQRKTTLPFYSSLRILCKVW